LLAQDFRPEGGTAIEVPMKGIARILRLDREALGCSAQETQVDALRPPDANQGGSEILLANCREHAYIITNRYKVQAAEAE
jgi:hypothetical protein